MLVFPRATRAEEEHSGDVEAGQEEDDGQQDGQKGWGKQVFQGGQGKDLPALGSRPCQPTP